MGLNRFDKIIDKYYYLFGYEIHLPKLFRDDLKVLTNLIDDESPLAEQAIEDAYTKWGCDPDLVRLGTFQSFLSEGDDDDGISRNF